MGGGGERRGEERRGQGKKGAGRGGGPKAPPPNALFSFPQHPFSSPPLSSPPLSPWHRPGEPGKRSHRAWTERREISPGGNGSPPNDTAGSGARGTGGREGRRWRRRRRGARTGKATRRETPTRHHRRAAARRTPSPEATHRAYWPRRETTPAAAGRGSRASGCGAATGPPTTTRRARRNAGDTHGIFPEPPTGGVGRPGAGGERDHANGVGGRPNGGRPGERRRGRGAVKLGPRA